MNKNEQEQLEKLISINDVLNQTDLIRELKHSSLLEKDIRMFSLLKQKYLHVEESDEKKHKFELECSFLHSTYLYLFERLYAETLDMDILHSIVDVLQKIEKNDLDQHSGSFQVGKLLKEIYIDKVIATTNTPTSSPHTLSWKDYKQMHPPNDAFL